MRLVYLSSWAVEGGEEKKKQAAAKAQQCLGAGEKDSHMEFTHFIFSNFPLDKNLAF